ncbi:MAG: hypothetical protein FWE09_05930, partial [Treponema sp.]|nr:hypothetical protein [Treponema sp.]
DRMTVKQTVEIPPDYRLVIDVPREVPVGRAILTFTPAPAGARAVPPRRKPISHYFGIISPETYGDGAAFQRQIRDEWDDRG